MRKGNEKPVIDKALEEHREVLSSLANLREKIKFAAEMIAQNLRRGGTVFFCGNGGSAADAQHLAGELVGKFLRDRPALAAVALNTNTSVITAVGNDYAFERVFARQIEALGKPGDCLVAISTSGTSPNVVEAVRAARGRGMLVIGMTGAGGGRLAEWCDICLEVPSHSTPRVQEMHLLVGHIICQMVEEALC
ncbi:D-sedoheptulose-7-phosphate isomerase [Calderihabitans maritimus]|uniref:Phosphoheptose isomerase n=1 Tax=Calderihabitans maritimus TaxID=1246530 RepID=A0A1Z5HXK6_9FIRM|nr:D-sedoheptulose 7-phosphate isomerase [Calderihabitans maritimus]GAW94071.1 phosphoheptose isomerase [Calderihabitans maritimus]